MENEAVKEIIKTKELTFDYIRHDEEGNEEGTIRAVDNVSLEVKQGDFIAILGHNGSGKSTLAKHINALLVPTSGTVWVDGRVTAEESNVWDIRQTAGMVFQNPDNQIIGQVVEEDVGFGPENMGVPTKEIWERVEESLKAVGMYEYRKYSPNKLSGGQKQRVSIAGVLAMHPKCIVLDEPTAGLDPKGRDEILGEISELREKTGMTIVLVSHSMEDVANYVNRIIVMNKGSVMYDDEPKKVFRHVKELEAVGLAAPSVTYIMHTLKEAGLAVETDATTLTEARDAILAACGCGKEK